jgi:hypothetical protein
VGYAHLANECLQPLGHVSGERLYARLLRPLTSLADNFLLHRLCMLLVYRPGLPGKGEVECFTHRNGVLRRLALPGSAPPTRLEMSVGVPEG